MYTLKASTPPLREPFLSGTSKTNINSAEGVATEEYPDETHSAYSEDSGSGTKSSGDQVDMLDSDQYDSDRGNRETTLAQRIQSNPMDSGEWVGQGKPDEPLDAGGSTATNDTWKENPRGQNDLVKNPVGPPGYTDGLVDQDGPGESSDAIASTTIKGTRKRGDRVEKHSGLCPTCNVMFTRQADLRRHMMIHL